MIRKKQKDSLQIKNRKGFNSKNVNFRCILMSGLICTGSVIFLGKYRTVASLRGRNLSHHVCFKSDEITHLILTRVRNFYTLKSFVATLSQ